MLCFEVVVFDVVDLIFGVDAWCPWLSRRRHETGIKRGVHFVSTQLPQCWGAELRSYLLTTCCACKKKKTRMMR